MERRKVPKEKEKEKEKEKKKEKEKRAHLDSAELARNTGLLLEELIVHHGGCEGVPVDGAEGGGHLPVTLGGEPLGNILAGPRAGEGG